MIIDCFTFFNELDLLEIRLNILSDVVDKFVLVEAEKTQSLIDKPLYYELNKDRYREFHDKIIHIKLDAEECPSNSTNLWNMENFQRNQIQRGLNKFNLTVADRVMVSDLDEIPDPKLIKEHKDAKISGFSFDMDFIAYYLNMWSPEKGWKGTVSVQGNLISMYKPQALRNMKDNIQSFYGGWHMSWIGGFDRVYEKFISCIEPLDKSTVPSKEELKKRFDDRIKNKGFFNLDDTKNNSVPLEVYSDDKLPEYITKNKNKYKHLIYE